MIPRSQLGVLCPSLLHLTWKSKLQRALQVISETARNRNGKNGATSEMARSKLHVSAELLMSGGGGTWWNMVEPRLRCKSEDVRSNAGFGCLFNQLE